MNTKIITTLADFINAYENYQDKVNDKKIMTKLDRVYKKILAAAEKYPDDFDRFNDHCMKNNLYTDFQQYTEKLKSILLNQ
jgi:hypothetical protein